MKHVESVNGLTGCGIGICNTKVESEHGKQHQNAPYKCVKEKFNGCIFAPWSSPETNQKVHRQQHSFPEDEEQEEIKSNKDTHHSGYQEQVKSKVPLSHLPYTPGRDHTDQPNERGKNDHNCTQSVKTQEIGNFNASNPWN